MQLNYKKYGESGGAVLILHGLLGSLDNWQTVARHISQKFQVYAIDLRNHGRSPHDNEDMDYGVMADDILEFCEQQQLNKIILIGHSMGGKVAMLFALEHPSVIEKLIVVDIAPVFYEVGHEDILSAMEDAPIHTATEREEVDAFLETRIPEYGMRQFVLKNLSRTDKGFEWKCNLPVIIKSNRALMEFPQINKNFSGSTFFIKGEQSDYITDERWSVARQFFPNAQLLTVHSSGHWVHAENPLEFMQVLDGVL
jgi:pimeloyl-ACP methyl ester carboxylesterase